MIQTIIIRTHTLEHHDMCVYMMISEKVKCYWSVLIITIHGAKKKKRRWKKHLTYYFFDLFIFYMSHVWGICIRASGWWCEYNMEIIQGTDIVACTHLSYYYKEKLFMPNEKCIFICQMVYISFFCARLNIWTQKECKKQFESREIKECVCVSFIYFKKLQFLWKH